MWNETRNSDGCTIRRLITMGLLKTANFQLLANDRIGHISGHGTPDLSLDDIL